MPLPAALLLDMNSLKARLGDYVSSLYMQALLIASLLLFGYLLIQEVLN